MEKHGFARTSEFTLESQENNRITFSLKENEDTLEHYPFKFVLSITYVLHENHFEIIYNVTSSQNILFSIGAHPAFKLQAELDKSYLEFEKEELSDLYCLDLDNGCITGTKENYLNTNVLKLEKDIFKNDALIFKGLNSNSVQLKNTQNSKKVKVDFNNFNNMGFWAPVGAPFVCIEPWCGIADDNNTTHELNQKDSIEFLNKDTVFSRSMQISLS